MRDTYITDDQIIALRVMAQHVLALFPGRLEQEQARSILLWANEALAGTRNSREARAVLFRVLENGTHYMTPEMRATYVQAARGCTIVLPAPEERTAYASRGYEAGVDVCAVGCRVGSEVVDFTVKGSQDRVTALRFLEMHLLAALADVRALRGEIQDDENPNPLGAARRYRNT